MNAAKYTNNQLAKLESRISEMYTEAKKDLEKKLSDYVNGYDEVIDGKKVHHMGMYERYDKEYQAFLNGEYHDETGKYTDQQVFNRWWYAQEGRRNDIEQMIVQMGTRLEDSAKIAQDYTNGILPGVWAKNKNYEAELAQSAAMKQGVVGYDFQMVNEEAVARLMTATGTVKPYNQVEVNLLKLNKYNSTKLRNALLQGVLQGDDLKAMTKRFQSVGNMNEAMARRNARTFTTRVQNMARMSAWDEAKEQGCEIYKMWLATDDERTREEHVKAEDEYGTEDNAIPYDEPFEVGDEELMYPGDPDGSPYNVYNCRCSMKCFYKFKSILSDDVRAKANIKVVG